MFQSLTNSQHPGKEFDNKLVKGLCSELERVVLLSKAFCPRENGKSESKVNYSRNPLSI